MATQKLCAYCSSIVMIGPYRLAHSKSGLFFCSKRCKGDWMIGKYTVPPEKYRGGMYRNLKRDGRTIKEHRLVMEKKLGRKLRSYEDVHHRNADTFDNTESNLVLLTKRAHRSLHSKKLRRGRHRELVRLRKSGKTLQQLSAHFDVSKKQIRAALEVNDMRGKLLITLPLKKILKLRCAGLSLAKIAAFIDAPNSTLWKFLRDKGITVPDWRVGKDKKLKNLAIP